MNPSRLLHAQLELSSHRLWLSSFLLRTRPPTRTYHQIRSPPKKQQGPPWRPQTERKVRRDAGQKIQPIRKYPVHDDSAKIRDMREAAKDSNIQKAVQIYSALSVEDKKRLLSASDCRVLSQCLHQVSRTTQQQASDAETTRATKDVLIAISELMIKDIMSGSLAPNCQAHVHLLGFLKETGRRDAGVTFWEWIKKQDELFVNPDVYGAAIELLAVNGSPLAELEDLYRQALMRFPDPFLEYHLSPGAIVPDRERTTTLGGIPMSLLQGILTARLLRGDARNAYLALDTALRLYPDLVPPRFFQLFIEERPLLEAYAVFAIACRAGIRLPLGLSRRLVGALRMSSDLSSPVSHTFAIRSMLSALYIYMCAGNQIVGNLITELVIAMTQFLRLKGVAGLEVQGKQKLVEEVMDMIRMTLTIFAQRGARPGLSAFNSIITNLGGFGQSKRIIGTALTDALTLGLQPNAVTHRSIVTAAGKLNDIAFLKTAWTNLVEAREETGQSPDATDFYVLVKNAFATGAVDFARQEFATLQKTLPDTDQVGILAALESRNDEGADRTTAMADLSALLEEIQKIRLDLDVIEGVTKNGIQVQDLHTAPFPITLLPSQEILPEAEMRELYDEYTVAADAKPATAVAESPPDESTPSPSYTSGEAGPAVSSTNIPFGTLRYENWKTINHLLAQSEASDQAYVDAVDRAIAAGKVPPRRPLGLSEVNDETTSFGLVDTMCVGEREGSVEERMMDDAQIEQGRAHIRRMRGPSLS